MLLIQRTVKGGACVKLAASYGDIRLMAPDDAAVSFFNFLCKEPHPKGWGELPHSHRTIYMVLCERHYCEGLENHHLEAHHR